MPGMAYLMFLTGGVALLAGWVATRVWRSRQLDLTWLVVLIAMFSVLLATGSLKLDQPQAAQVAPGQAQVDRRGEPGQVRPDKREARRLERQRARHVPSRPPSLLGFFNLTLLARVTMLLYVAGALKFCAAFVPSRQRLAGESTRLLQAEVTQPLKLLTIAVELGLLVLVMRLYNIESSVLSDKIMPLAFYGFLLHDLMPVRWRPSFFVLLSLTGIYLVFGWASATLLVGFGLLLLSLLYLPFRFSVRLIILLVVGIALAGARFHWANANVVGIIWPILGSMFMFRLISYAHYVKHHKPERDIPFAIAYFFLLPNVVFPLFPVVDYAIFRRTYYNTDKYASYQTGIHWMARGITHLLIYRLVYHYLVIGPGDVTTVWTLLRYMMANFLLMLRITGQLHLVIGILHLFGFNLPEVVRRLFLASSFSDLWKRANIYWRDFMQKIVFFPVYFRLRNYGAGTRVVVATLIVFLISALFHSYQWFWLRGSVSVAWPEVLFWTAFAVLVARNVWKEEKQTARESAGQSDSGWTEALGVGMRSAGTFVGISILWSLWSSNSLLEWSRLWLVAGTGLTKVDIPTFVCGVILLAIIGFSAVEHHFENRVKPRAKSHSFALSSAITGLCVLALYVLGSPSTYMRFNAKVVAGFQHIRTDELNDEDAFLLQRAYYENLTRLNRFNPGLWGVYMQRRDNPPNLEESGVLRLRTGSVLGTELRPDRSASFNGAPFHTNKWGMRDRDREEKKPPHTKRIALLGASPVMGSGVGDDQTFAWLLEDRLNREAISPNRYEVLNFAVGGYSSVQRLAAMEEKAFRFDPDLVVYTAHQGDAKNALRDLGLKISGPIPFPELRDILRRANLESEQPQRSSPLNDEIVTWTYCRVVDDCRKRGILPVYVFLPVLRPVDPSEGQKGMRVAREAGFDTLDLSGVYGVEDLRSLWVSEHDPHPNAEAHKMIADKLYRELHKDPKTRERLGW
jgi:hypothetical protein